MSINYQMTYNQGYDAGQRLYARSPNYRLPELRKVAEQETARQDLPMVLQVHYRDGLIAGYGPKQASKAEKSSTAQEGRS